MKKIIDPIYLDAAGIESLNKDILASQERIDNLEKKEGQTLNSDDLMSSADLQKIRLDKIKELSILNGLLDARKRVVLVEKNNAIDLVDINDTILIDLVYSETDIEEMIIKLVAGIGDLNLDIKQISVNSPLGSAIYGKKIGEETSYLVGENEFHVSIKSKLNLNNENPPKR